MNPKNLRTSSFVPEVEPGTKMPQTARTCLQQALEDAQGAGSHEKKLKWQIWTDRAVHAVAQYSHCMRSYILTVKADVDAEGKNAIEAVKKIIFPHGVFLTPMQPVRSTEAMRLARLRSRHPSRKYH